MSEKYILASASPRRREICRMAGIPVEIVPADFEPPLDPKLFVKHAVLKVAKAKAEQVSARFPDRTVIAADTVVSVNGHILGKPKDKADAAAMLRLLSGNIHQVYTGVWVCSRWISAGFTEKSEVKFYPLTESEIEEYVESGDPMDKAGAYGIQGPGMKLIRDIRGDFYNVMGLPGARLIRFLKEHDM